MTDTEAYVWLGSHPCEDCNNCNIGENLKPVENRWIKPRHCKNSFEMREYCHENFPCDRAKQYDDNYNELINLN